MGKGIIGCSFVCINNIKGRLNLTIGKEYVVRSLTKGTSGGYSISVVNDRGFMSTYDDTVLVDISVYRNQVIEEILV